jgi:Alternative complex III, ActD subunit
MRNQFVFEEKQPFLHQLEKLIQEGVSPKNINVYTPYPVHEVEEILQIKTSPLRYFTLIGALSGLLFGLFFTIWTSLDWPIIRGGKPIVALPPFVIIAFELTVLFGGVISFIGYLLLARLPSVKTIIQPEEYGNQFVIHLQSEAKK